MTGFVEAARDRKSTRLNSSLGYISYAVFCLKKKKRRRCGCGVRAADRRWPSASARGLGSVALDGFGIGRVGAHVDALLPRALERIAHVEPHAPDAVDLEVHDLAVLQRPEAFVVGATRDDVARVKRHDRGGELDQLGHEV